MVGWSACTIDGSNVSCSAAQYAENRDTVVHLRVSSLWTDTGFNLDNGSIELVDPVSPLTPIFYSASDIFEVFDLALNDSLVQTTILQILGGNSVGSGINSDIEPWYLRNLIASPLFEYNQGTQWVGVYDGIPSMYVKGHYATEIYRLVIPDYSLFLFTLLAVGVLVWCLSVFIFCWVFAKELTPNGSEFAEWDFASKCVVIDGCDDTGMAELMSGLANASSQEVKERIKSKRIGVGAVGDTTMSGVESRIVMATNGALRPLKSNKVYA
jgi:hypothetical protein